MKINQSPNKKIMQRVEGKQRGGRCEVHCKNFIRPIKNNTTSGKPRRMTKKMVWGFLKVMKGMALPPPKIGRQRSS